MPQSYDPQSVQTRVDGYHDKLDAFKDGMSSLNSATSSALGSNTGAGLGGSGTGGGGTGTGGTGTGGTGTGGTGTGGGTTAGGVIQFVRGTTTFLSARTFADGEPGLVLDDFDYPRLVVKTTNGLKPLSVRASDITGLSAIIAAGVTTDQMNAALANRVTSDQLTAALVGRVTSGELATALSDKVTTGQLTSALSDKITSSQLDAAMADKVTDGELTAALADVATTTDLAKKLDAPVTPGTAGKILGLDGNLKEVWTDAPSSLPSQTGFSGKFLTTDGSTLSWSNTPIYFSNPMTALGDMILGISGGGGSRLPIGTAGQVLTVVGGTASWQPIPSQFPSMVGNSGKVLTNNGSTVTWTTVDAFPSQTGQSGKFLTTNGSSVSWTPIAVVPDVTSQSGKFLTNNGTVASWASLPSQFPTQTGNSGKFLTTNGTDVAWATVAAGATTNLNSFSPDAKPLSPSAYDDEFTSNALDGKWTVVNSGSASVLASNSSIPDNLHIRMNNAGRTLVCLLQAIPAGDFTVYTKATQAHAMVANPEMSGGLLLSTTNTAGTGSQALVMNVAYQAAQEYVQVWGWTNFNTVGSQIVAGLSFQDAAYQGLRRVGSSWFVGVSPDGLVWTWTAFTPGFTPAYIGLHCHCNQAFQADFAYEFFRYVPSATGQLGGPIQATVASPTIPGVVKPGTGLTVAADGTLNVQVNTPVPMVVGQLMGTVWTPENTGNLAVTQDGLYGLKFGYSGTDGSNNLRGGYIPYTPATRRIVWDTEITNAVSYALGGLCFRAADGTLFGFVLHYDGKTYTAPTTSAAVTPAFVQQGYTSPTPFMQNALDIDASGNWVWYTWSGGRWRQIGTGTLAFTPTGLGYYHRTYGTNTLSRLSGLAFKTYQSELGPESQQAVLAPPPPSFDVYSTEEVRTSKLHNGKPVYRKLVDCGALPNTTTKNVAHGIDGVGEFIRLFGYGYDSSVGTSIVLPHVNSSAATLSIQVHVNGANLILTTGSDRTAYTAKVVLEYTKTVDATITPTPSGWMLNDVYSLSETLTNMVWIDGSPIYRKVINFGALPNSTTKTVAHGIVGASRVWIDPSASFAYDATYGYPLPYAGTGTEGIKLYLTNTGIVASTAIDRSGVTATVTLLFTKFLVQFTTENILARVLLNENTGTTAANTGPSGGTASIPAGATWSDGGLSQPGNVNGMTFNVPRTATATTPTTVMGWIKLGTATGSHEDFAVLGGTSRRTFIVSRMGTRVMCYWDGVGWLQSSVALPTGVWTHVAWVVDPVNSALKLYKDGVLAETLGRATWTAPNAATITVGSSVNEYFTGGIHDFYAYDSVLSSEEIKAHFTAGR